MKTKIHRQILGIMALLTLGFQATAEDSIEASYQREYVYLTSQKESLQRQRERMAETSKKRLNSLKTTVAQMQGQVARLTAENDENHEQLMDLEKQKKELRKRGASLATTYEKASQTLTQFERELRFDSEKMDGKVTAPDDLKVVDLEPLFVKTIDLLKQSSSATHFEGYYLDEKGDLRKGNIRRLGRVAAFVQSQNGDEILLGPSGTGPLKTLEARTGGGLYLFDDLSEAAHVQKAATWVEGLADLGPLLFLGLMLMLVAGLFMALVRI